MQFNGQLLEVLRSAMETHLGFFFFFWISFFHFISFSSLKSVQSIGRNLIYDGKPSPIGPSKEMIHSIGKMIYLIRKKKKKNLKKS
jgi:hypothetical protein